MHAQCTHMHSMTTGCGHCRINSPELPTPKGNPNMHFCAVESVYSYMYPEKKRAAVKEDITISRRKHADPLCHYAVCSGKQQVYMPPFIHVHRTIMHVFSFPFQLSPHIFFFIILQPHSSTFLSRTVRTLQQQPCHTFRLPARPIYRIRVTYQTRDSISGE